MVDFNDLYALQQQLANPMFNVNVAQAGAPRPLGAPSPPDNSMAATTLMLNQLNRIPEMRIAEEQRAIENERAQRTQDLQMLTLQHKMSQQADLSKTEKSYRAP